MRYAIVSAALFASASAHGVIRSIEGANGVSMPGLSVADGTPRDCITPSCGAEADTSIIRDNELGSDKASALGRTKGSGPVDAATGVASFMGTSAGATNRRDEPKRQARGLLSGLLGGGGGAGGASDSSTSAGISSTSAGTKDKFAQETIVGDSAGVGATKGLPTCSDTGEVSMTFRQVNQDGAGPMTADVDGTSGGTDPSAFQSAQVTQDVPGVGVGGLSLASSTDFPMKVQMPAGMTCDGTVAGAKNVCVVRVRNGAIAGPFGGSAAFTMSTAARKRAIAYRLKKRMEINRE